MGVFRQMRMNRLIVFISFSLLFRSLSIVFFCIPRMNLAEWGLFNKAHLKGFSLDLRYCDDLPWTGRRSV